LYWRVIEQLINDWTDDGNYSHGFLILPLALCFAYERRHQLRAAEPKPATAGLGAIAASLAVLITGVLGAELFLARISLVLLTFGLVLFVWGWHHARILVFPIGCLLLMIPIPAIVFNQITFPLQILASQFGEAVLRLVGIPVLREGNVMILANTTLEVAEACSGIRSLVSLVTLGIVVGHFTDSRAWVRTAIAVAAVPIAILANGLRVAGTGIAAHAAGPQAAAGFFHTFSGGMVFAVSLLLLFAFQRGLATVGRGQNWGATS
jgi:exosortase